MTVSSTAAASGPFIGTGASQTLPFTFHAASADEVRVEVDGTAVAGFTVTLESDGTGSVTGIFASGATVYVESEPSFQQNDDFNRFAPVFPDAFNPPLDRAAIRDIALKDRVDRSFAIPRDISAVVGKYPVVLSDGSAGFASGTGGGDTALRTDLATDGGPIVGVRGRGPGVIRSQQQINEEGLGLVKDFGAIGNGSALNNSRIAGAFAETVGNGWTLDIPAGSYKFDQPITEVLPSAPLIGGSGRKPQFVGAGAANVSLIFDGDEDDDAIFLTGNAPGVERMLLSGFRILRPDKAGMAGGTGAGLRLRNFCGFSLYDVFAQRHGVGIQLEGCLVGVIDTCSMLYNDTNLNCLSGPGLISTPNMLQVLRSTINTAALRGVKVVSGSQLTFADCTFEGIGAENPDPDSAIALEVIGLGGAGAIALNVDRCYFEANRGVSIYLNHALDFNATYSITRTNFNRFSDFHTLADVTFDASALSSGAVSQANLLLDGSTFTAFGAYTPDPTKPYLSFNLGSYTGLRLHDDRAMFLPASEKGSIPDAVRRYGQPIAVTFNGAWSFSSIGPTFEATVLRDLTNRVRMSGIVEPNGNSTADGQVMFTLPVGARPRREYEEFVCGRQGGICTVRAFATGDVAIYGASGADFISLNGVEFDAQ